MNTISLFSEFKKLGYKKHSEKPFNELDELPFDSIERTIEQSLVYKWLRDVYKIYCNITPHYENYQILLGNRPYKSNEFKENVAFVYNITIDENNVHAAVGVSYEEAEYKSMVEVINVLKNKL